MSTRKPKGKHLPSTFAEVIQGHMEKNANDPVFTFLKNGEIAADTLSHYSLYSRAAIISSYLRECGISKGDRVLLVYPSGLEFIRAFTACLLSGVIAVPASMPKKNRSISRICGIIKNSDPKLILTEGHFKQYLEEIFKDSEAQSISVVDTSEVESSTDYEAKISISPEDLAFLQYTSGSTGNPKGVAISHENIVANQRQIQSGFRTCRDSRLVSWLPAHHDMGLIGGILHPLFLGFHCHLMPPTAFVQQPARWLKAITNFRATVGGGPNFAYDLCVKYVSDEEKESIDLSSWACAFSGAEKVRAETIDNFCSAFSQSGFKRKYFYPCYGMAETTLFVTGGDPGAMPIRRQVRQSLVNGQKELADDRRIDPLVDVIGCGRALADESLIIVDPNSGERCNPNNLGEIWVRGKNVAKGYWRNELETQERFQATLTGSDAQRHSGQYFKTGDLGYVDESEELFICGRLKELLIIRGVNYHPQDIERSVQDSHEALVVNSGAAFSIEKNGRESLIVVNEIARSARKNLNADEVFASIRKKVSRDHELDIDTIVLLKPMTVMKTSSGKIRRLAMKDKFLAGSLETFAENRRHSPHDVAITEKTASSQFSADLFDSIDPLKSKKARDIQQWLVSQIAREQDIPSQTVLIDTPLAEFGLSSISMVRIAAELEGYISETVPSTLLYDYPTVRALAHYLSAGPSKNQEITDSHRSPPSAVEQVAVIGIGCRLPGGVSNANDFWQLLLNEVNTSQEIPNNRWQWNGENTAERDGNFLKQVKDFDAEFFNISPKEAESLDPQQRILLEVCWQAIEDAVIAPNSISGTKTGVFIGASSNDYARLLEENNTVNRHYGSGNSLSMAAGRLAYFFGLTGPALVIDTACSSSLVAVHNAREAIVNGQCDMALAGGINLILSKTTTGVLSQANMLSKHGRCAAFDDEADGYVRGEGCGVVMLKRLSDAVRDGDRIYGLLKGSALNQDGRSNGLTAPSGIAQQGVIREALISAGVEARDVDYVEAHGTGTPLGDPIELRALQAALGRDRKEALKIGSVKTNIGHLEPAAGIVGLIKLLLSAYHGKIPKHLHLKNKTKHFNWEQLSIPENVTDWENTLKSFTERKVRVGGVSSFGFSGTNAHVIVESHDNNSEARRPAEIDSADDCHWVSFSAKSPKALVELVENCRLNILESNRDHHLDDICDNINRSNCHFSYRFSTVVCSRVELIEKLYLPASAHFTPAGEDRPISFLFTGQGAQYMNMGYGLYHRYDVFKNAFDECEEIIKRATGWSLLDSVFSEDSKINRRTLAQTSVAQPAIFSFEYALFKLFESVGVTPSTVIGHSLGEYTAACVAGIFNLNDALNLVCQRGCLMQAQAKGSMLSVAATPEQVLDRLKGVENLEVAAINGYKSIVISGSHDAIDDFSAYCEFEGVPTTKLNVSHAFHSKMMEPMLDEYREALNGITLSQPKIDIISNLSGKCVTTEMSTADYWCQHILAPVEFAKSIETLSEMTAGCVLECGPSPVLIGLIKDAQNTRSNLTETLDKEGRVYLENIEKFDFIAVDRYIRADEGKNFLQVLSRLYQNGWTPPHLVSRQAQHRFPLLQYPFQRQSFWVDTTGVSEQPSPHLGASSGHPLIGELLNLPLAKEKRFAAKLSAESPAYMSDHRLYSVVVAPAASHLSSIIIAAQRLSVHQELSLNDVVFEQAMILNENVVLDVQIIIQENDNDRSDWRLVSTDKPYGDAVVHALGQYQSLEQDLEVTRSCATASVKYRADFEHQHSKYRRAADFYEQMHSGGYHLGKSFKWLEEIYQDSDEAGALITIPEVEENLRDFPIHPGLLDSCLQMVSLACESALDLQNGKYLYVPIKLKRIVVFQKVNRASELWCYSRAITKLTSKLGLAADIYLSDQDGQPIIMIEGFETRRVNAELLLGSLGKGEPEKDWLYTIAWKKEQRPGFWLPPDYMPSPEKIATSLRSVWQEAVERNDLYQYTQILNRLESHSLVYVLQAFKLLGWSYSVGSSFTIEDLISNLQLDSKYVRLVGRLVAILTDDNLLSQHDERFRVESSLDDLIAKYSQEERQGDDGFPEFVMLKRCGGELAAVLKGQIDPLELLFPDGDTSIASRLYTDTPGAKALNQTVSRVVDEIVQTLPSQRRLRVLEIGAGTGGTSAHLLPKLDPALTEYTFTDMSQHFLGQAREKFSEYPFIHYQVLDIEKTPLQQGFAQNHYDIVVAANVLHATKNLTDTLMHVHQLLASSGALIIVEGTTRLRWLDLTFGLTSGWWRYEDLGVRPDYPLLSTEKWKQILGDNDFRDPSILTRLNDGSGTLEEQSIIVAQRGNENLLPKHWLLVTDRQGVAGQLAQALTDMGDLCSIVDFIDNSIQVHSGSSADAINENCEVSTFNIEDVSHDGFQLLVQEIESRQGCQIHEVLQFQGLDTPDPKGCDSTRIMDYLERLTAVNLVLIKTLVHDMNRAPRKLTLISAGAVGPEGYSATGLAAAPIWGMGKTLDMEYPEMHCKRIDLEPGDPSAMSNNLLTVLLNNSHETEIAIRRDALFYSRLVQLSKDHSVTKTTIKENASYLVTGGLSGMGLLFAQWLVNNGARSLILLSRSRGKSDALDAINTWTAAGISVRTFEADVGDLECMSDIFEKKISDLPPLAGVIHSAGVLDDAVLANQSVEKFSIVMKPKVMGSWNLHVLTKTENLDFFVLFSSVASLLGSPGQANHSAANSFMDALASYRRELHLPAMSINWGAWSDVGAASRLQSNTRLKTKGIESIQPEAGIRLFEYLLNRPQLESQVGVVPINWRRFKDELEAYGTPAFYADIYKAMEVKKSNDASVSKQSGWRDRIENAPVGQKKSVLQDLIKKLASETLGLNSVNQMDIDTPLNDLGLDSLMAMDLVSELNQNLGIKIPSNELLQNPSVSQLTEINLKILQTAGMIDMFDTNDRAKAQPAEDSGGGNWFPHRVSKGPGALKLFCLHYLGGGASVFRGWRDSFGPNVEVVAIQLPGREERINEAAYSTLESLIPSLVAQVLPLIDGPYAIYGHSMGSLIGYELQQAIKAETAREPIHFWASAYYAPHCTSPFQKDREWSDERILETLPRLIEAPKQILENKDFVDALLPTIRADLGIVSRYKFARDLHALNCSITAMGGREDKEVMLEDIAQWKDHTQGQFNQVELSGGHIFVNENRDEVIAHIKGVLDSFLTHDEEIRTVETQVEEPAPQPE